MRNSKTVKPEELIKSIRQSFIGSEQVYTQGSCIMFYRILKTVYPDAKPYWSQQGKHMITRIGNLYYDITGIVTKTDDYKLDEDAWISLPIAVAFPQRGERRFRFPTPTKLI